jgi:hypothetical protein
LPQLRDGKEFLRKSGVIIFVSLCAAFAFLRLESLKEFTGIAQAYPDYSDAGSTVTKALGAIPALVSSIWRGDLFGVYTGWVSLATKVGLLVVVGLSVWALVQTLKGNLWRFEQLKKPAAVLVLAAVYFALITYLPFMLAGQAPEADGLRGAAVGLVLLALVPLQINSARRTRAVVAIVCGFLIGAGLLAYSVSDRAAISDDAYLSRFIYTLKQQVPGVRGSANFVFVNSGVGRTGCIGLMNMLYGRSDLHCIHLFDNDEEEKYTRVPEGLQEVDGRLWDAGFILITIAPNGTAILLADITQQEFPAAPITWDVADPLLPDEDFILRADYQQPTKAQRAAIKMLRLQPPSPLFDYFAEQN